MAQLENLVTESTQTEREDGWIEFQLFETALYKNWPLFPKEITDHFNLFTIAPAIYTSNCSYYHPMLYDGMRLRIQTPILHVPFNIQTYRNPGSQIEKYSLHVSLQCLKPEQKDFKEFLQKVDTMVMSMVPLPPETYFSCIRYNYANPTLPPVMRIKIPADENVLLIDVFNEGDTISGPTVEQLKGILAGECSVKCVIEMNPVWVAGGKFGISYKLIQLVIYQNEAAPPLIR